MQDPRITVKETGSKNTDHHKNQLSPADDEPIVQESKKLSLTDKAHQVDQGKKQIIYRQGPSYSKKVALTFDDGPDDYYTVKILDILKREKVPATFFIMGRNAIKYPIVLKRIAKEGHLIGNHSWDHPDFRKISPKQIKWEIKNTERFIHHHTGVQPSLFRPPFGEVSEELKNYIAKSHYTIINWNVDTKDWTERPASKIMTEVREHVSPGAIILLHSAGGGQSLQGTVDALPQIIRYLRQNDYEIITIDKLLNIPSYVNSFK
jgi:peptidoglycan/xylan/chitin deacetylase (PgdA/CDA1 family)